MPFASRAVLTLAFCEAERLRTKPMYRPCCFRRARTLAERGFRRRVGAAPTFARRPGFEDPTRWARRRRELLRAGFPAIGNGPSFPARARRGFRLSRSAATLWPRSFRIV